MLTDLGFAIGHHVFVFGLMAMLAAQVGLVRPGMDSAAVARVARLDRGYGMVAVLVVVVGVLRVLYGAKGLMFYETNPWFMAEMAAFVAVGLMSIVPTRQYMRWNRALKADPAFVPPEGEIGRLLPWLRIQGAMILVVAALAAAMARYGGF